MATSTIETPTVQTPTLTQTPVVEISFGSGRYSAASLEFFNDLQRLFKLPDKAAEKIARKWASDFGAAMKEATIAATVSGKPSKDGELTCKEAAKIKVRATYAISLMRLCVYLDEGFKFGLNPNKTSYILNEELTLYLAECSKV